MAGSKFLNAVSVIALTAGIVTTTTTVALVGSVSIAQAAVISRVVVKGNSRVDSSTIAGNITIKPGKRFSNNDVDDSVKRLFATGLFSDVRISQSGSTLVVNVDENQIVNQVIFNGNRKIKDKRLEKVVQIRTLGAFNELLLASDEQAIRDAYAAIGRNDAVVTSQVVNLGGGRVNIAFEVNEGDRTKIDSISFVGNSSFSDGHLRDVIRTKRSNILAFLSRNDIYDEDKLRADEELLRRFYYDHGYADFTIVSSNAELNETTNEYAITISVDEGERYAFGDVSIDSSIPGIDNDALAKELKSRSGDTYSAKNIEKTIENLSDRVAGDGYPFVQIIPRGERDYTNRTISVSYVVDQGQRAYIERIEIRGNSRTRDYVIRREFDFSEGDAFNQVLLRRARKRLEALGYFERVNISTVPGSDSDRVILVVDVEDKPTAEFSIGGGYTTGSAGGPSFELSLKERNFLGRGQYFKLAFGGGIRKRNFDLSFTEPYFLGYRLAVGFDLSQSQNTSETNYDSTVDTAVFRIAAPITENFSAQLAYKFNRGKYVKKGVAVLSPAIQSAIDSSPFVTSSLSYTLTYDTIDNKTVPRDGIYASFTQEFAGIGGDAKFLKTTARATYYHSLNESNDIVGLLRVGAGHVMATSGNLRVFDQFFIGGETVRGFDSAGLGPRDSNGDSVGGTTYFHATAEATFPLPVFPRSSGFRGAVFADAGTLYGSNLANNTGISGIGMNWRASVGASIIWSSPFGPIRFDYAVPVAKQSFDKLQSFHFGASTKF